MQQKSAIRTMQEKALKMICLFYEMYTYSIRDEDPDFVPSYDDKTAGEMLAQKLLLDDNFCYDDFKKYLRICNVT